MGAGERSRLVSNLIGALKPVPTFIQLRQIGHFYKADPEYGSRDAAGIGIQEVIGKAA